MYPTTRWNPTKNMFSGPRLFSYTKYIIKKHNILPSSNPNATCKNKRTSSRCPKRDAWQRRGYGWLWCVAFVSKILQKLRSWKGGTCLPHDTRYYEQTWSKCMNYFGQNAWTILRLHIQALWIYDDFSGVGLKKVSWITAGPELSLINGSNSKDTSIRASQARIQEITEVKHCWLI